MATMAMYGKLGANIFGGETAGESVAIDFLSDTIKVALVASGYTPDVDTHEFFSDITNELSTANGYTAGGYTLAAKALTYNATGNKTVLDNTVDPTWVASGGSIAFRYVVAYKSTGTGSTSPLIGVLDYGSTQTITDGNTVSVVLDAVDGLFKVTAT